MSNYPKKKLYRSATNVKIAGVCGGLGEFFNISPVLFRITFLLFFLPGGVPGALLYLLCWVLMPRQPHYNRTIYSRYPRYSDSTGKDYTETYDI